MNNSPGSSGPLKQSAWRGKAPSGDWTNFISVTFNTDQSNFFTSAGASCYLLDISYRWLLALGCFYTWGPMVHKVSFISSLLEKVVSGSCWHNTDELWMQPRNV